MKISCWERETRLYTVQDGWVEDVDTGVDSVPNELDGFLDEAVNAGGVFSGDDNTICGWLGDRGDLRKKKAVSLSLTECGRDYLTMMEPSHL